MAAEIPADELGAFVKAVLASHGHAVEGDPMLGYGSLRRDFEKARARSTGQPWATQLAAMYMDALAQYARVRGIKVE